MIGILRGNFVCRKVRALYQCVAENNAELSFGQGAIITNGMCYKII